MRAHAVTGNLLSPHGRGRPYSRTSPLSNMDVYLRDLQGEDRGGQRLRETADVASSIVAATILLAATTVAFLTMNAVSSSRAGHPSRCDNATGDADADERGGSQCRQEASASVRAGTPPQRPRSGFPEISPDGTAVAFASSAGQPRPRRHQRIGRRLRPRPRRRQNGTGQPQHERSPGCWRVRQRPVDRRYRWPLRLVLVHRHRPARPGGSGRRHLQRLRPRPDGRHDDPRQLRRRPGRQRLIVSALSPDGSLLAFRSDASNLVSGDTNDVADAFLRRPDTADLAISLTARGSLPTQGGLDPDRRQRRPERAHLRNRHRPTSQ